MSRLIDTVFAVIHPIVSFLVLSRIAAGTQDWQDLVFVAVMLGCLWGRSTIDAVEAWEPSK